MKYLLKHNTTYYIRCNIIIWFLKFVNRIYIQRRSLTFIVFIIQFILYLIFEKISFLFLLLIFVIVIIDLIITFIKAIKVKSKVDVYIEKGGEDIEFIVNENFVAFKQDDKIFHMTKWEEIYEVIMLKNPSVISFKNKNTKYLFILHENELLNGFFEIRDILLNKLSPTGGLKVLYGGKF